MSPHIIIPQEVYLSLIPEDQNEEIRPALYQFILKHCDVYLDVSFNTANHLLRLPYSIHEDTGLVSIPILADTYDDFDMQLAKIDQVKVDWSWFDVKDLLQKQLGMRALLNDALKEERIK